MRCKRLFALFTAALMTAALPQVSAITDVTAIAADKTSTDYSYAVTPMLSPINQYFYVKTENPDPQSIRFVDKSTVYANEGAYGSISLDYDSWDEEINLYADVVYENKETGRVKGGYIFTGSNTDGGEVLMQYKKEISYSEYNKLINSGESANVGQITETTSSSGSGGVSTKSYRIVGYYQWVDTQTKITLPKLMSSTDYLIDTYSSKDKSFFENMTAVQSGFSSICLYSGSSIRGELYKASENWAMSTSPHADQTFYIQSPYSRRDGKSLFATAIYPYRYDSLGFPSVMGTVAKKLDPSATYEWDSNNHYIINVTCNGETKSYGGQGNGKGRQISEDKIIKKFTFGDNEAEITLASAKALLVDYAKVEMTDDVPRDDALTWKQVWDTVGDGAWTRMIGINSIYGSSSNTYSYLYQKGDGSYFYKEAAGTNGAEIYWGGNLGYASNTWVDGRYVDKYERYVPGEKFEDHPTANLILKDYSFPLVSYKKTYKGYDSEQGKYIYDYSDISVTYKKMTVPFYYNSTGKVWKADSSVYSDKGYSYYDDVAAMTEKGLLDESVQSAMCLTEDVVKTLGVDKNTNNLPRQGYIYDGSAPAGTPFNYLPGDVNSDGVVDIKDVTLLKQYLAKWNVTINTASADVTGDGEVNVKDLTLLKQYLAKWKVTLK
ncbi:MAG: dockerin type I repeat-containing protein [Ruminococcus sp.]|nr:dockerin type I repeat-containing protein [Ruminococcus sp.]